MSSTRVAVAVRGRIEAEFVTTLGRSRSLDVVRRCADLPELLAVAAAGQADVAVVSVDLPGLDLTSIRDLRVNDVAVLGVARRDDEPAERLLRQLGLTVVVTADANPAQIEGAVESALGDGAWRRESGADRDLDAMLSEALDPAWSPEEAPPAAPAGLLGGAARRSATDDLAGAGPDRPAGVSAPEPIRAVAQPPDLRAGAMEVSIDHGAIGASLADVASSSGQVVAVWGPAGAPGRTTVALNIAGELARRGVETLLIDADPYGGVVAQALSLVDDVPGLAAAARTADKGTLDLPALAQLAPEVSARLRVLTGIPKAERWTELRPAPVERVLTLSRLLATVVVVDCGFCLEDDEELSYDTVAPRRNAVTLTVLEEADQVLVVGAADPVGLQRLVRGLQELGSVRCPGRRTVVVNKVRDSAVGGHAAERVRSALARFAPAGEEVRLIPDDRDALDGALLAGRTLAEHAPLSPARRALADLSEELAGLEPTGVAPRRGLRGIIKLRQGS